KISASANHTYQLLRKGYPIEKIAQMRQLKENTICDHIVEISLHVSSFSITKYVNQDVQDQIIRAIELTKSYKLKDIKGKLSEDISYFQIRLVLTKINMHKKVSQ